jgi:small GTP-binding protein
MNRPTLSKRWRVLLVGDTDTGKTTFFQRFVKKEPVTDIVSTIGTDFYTYKTSRQNQPIELQVWDTAGRMSFRTITKSYFHGTDMFLLFFDSTRTSCLESLKAWVEDIQEKNIHHAPIFLVITKVDEPTTMPLKDIMMAALELNLRNEHVYLLSRKEIDGEVILRDCIDTLWRRHTHPLNTKEEWEESAPTPKIQRTWLQYFLSYL